MRIKKIIFFILTITLFSCGDRRPMKIFCALFDCDKFKSVKIIHSEDQDFLECCIWLHFTIDSDELTNELSNCREREITNFSNIAEHEAKWWIPNKMGTKIRCFSRDKNGCIETFYVNEKFTEVYYNNYNGAH